MKVYPIGRYQFEYIAFRLKLSFLRLQYLQHVFSLTTQSCLRAAFTLSCKTINMQYISTINILILCLPEFDPVLRLGSRKTGLRPPAPQYFNTDRSKAVLLLWFLTVTCSCCPYLYFGSAIMLVTYYSKF